MPLERTEFFIRFDTLQDFAKDHIAKSSFAAMHNDFEKVRLLGPRIPKEVNPDRCVNDRWHDCARFVRS
jgi:hypothetical protein